MSFLSERLLPYNITNEDTLFKTNLEARSHQASHGILVAVDPISGRVEYFTQSRCLVSSLLENTDKRNLIPDLIKIVNVANIEKYLNVCRLASVKLVYDDKLQSLMPTKFKSYPSYDKCVVVPITSYLLVVGNILRSYGSCRVGLTLIDKTSFRCVVNPSHLQSITTGTMSVVVMPEGKEVLVNYSDIVEMKMLRPTRGLS